MKKEIQKIDRREFTAASVVALLSGVAITLSGCGGGSSSPAAPSPSNGTSSSGDRTGAVSANHGHTAVLTSAQVSAANAVTLGIQGSSNHPHSVELSSAEVQQIGNGQRVSKTSSNNDAHTHTVTFN
jgi:hypothetical protein